jgi:hypothetical protein
MSGYSIYSAKCFHMFHSSFLCHRDRVAQRTFPPFCTSYIHFFRFLAHCLYNTSWLVAKYHKVRVGQIPSSQQSQLYRPTMRESPSQRLPFFSIQLLTRDAVVYNSRPSDGQNTLDAQRPLSPIFTLNLKASSCHVHMPRFMSLDQYTTSFEVK